VSEALNNIIQESIAAVEVAGRPIDTHAAAKYGISRILANAELTCMAVTEWFTGKVQGAIKRPGRLRGLLSPSEYVMASRAGMDGAEDITMLVPRQYDFWKDPFDLDDGYSLEGGTGKVVRTRNATMPDFEGFIRIRVKQNKADLRHLNRMRVTLERLRPFWANDPEMSYREACDLYVRQHGMPPKDEHDEDDD
jgi:hypothetical protein